VSRDVNVDSQCFAESNSPIVPLSIPLNLMGDLDQLNSDTYKDRDLESLPKTVESHNNLMVQDDDIFQQPHVPEYTNTNATKPRLGFFLP